MPPKKKLCRSKDQRSIIEVFRGCSDESENNSNDQTKPAPLEDTPKQPPTNKFIPKWFKLYSWLKYNQEKDFMFCNICTEHGKRNGMVEHCQNRNFKKTTLDRHAVLPDHQAAIQAPILKEDFQACQAKSSCLWQLISKYHKADFPNLIKLAQLALTSAVHTAGCERGFSAQNAILMKGRNRLLVENQHKLMRVKMTADIDYEQVIQIWRQKNRRLYKAK